MVLGSVLEFLTFDIDTFGKPLSFRQSCQCQWLGAPKKYLCPLFAVVAFPIIDVKTDDLYSEFRVDAEWNLPGERVWFYLIVNLTTI